jgi:hypothetical protein
MEKGAKIQPAKRVAGRRQDVWYVANLLISMMRIIHLLPNPFQLSRERERERERESISEAGMAQDHQKMILP